MIKKIRTADVIVTPRAGAKIRLDELNTMLNEMQKGEAAVRKMAMNDASRGLVDAPTKRAAEAEYKAGQQSQQAPFQAPQNAALSDRDIAANMVFQAKQMELNAKQMIAEAARMKKEAQSMDPNVVAREAPKPEVAPAPKRGRPAKTTAVAVDAQ